MPRAWSQPRARHDHTVREKGKGHGLGSPHIHIATSLVESLSKQAGDSDDHLIVREFSVCMQSARMEEIGDIVTHCTVREAYSQGSKEDKKTKLSIALNPLASLPGNDKCSLPRLRQAILALLKNEGAQFIKETAPPAEIEWVVQKHLR